MKIAIFTLLCICSLYTQDLFHVGEIEEYAQCELSANDVGKTFTACGKLEKQGDFRYFTTYVYKENLFVKQRYYVANDVEVKSSWLEVTAKYTHIEDMRIEIEIQKHRKVDAANWNKVCELNQHFFTKNFARFDLNLFKKTARFARAMQHLKNKDLNKSPYIKDASPQIAFFDCKQQIVAVYCGKSILHKSEIRGDFLSYHIIYDLKNNKILRVRATNTGYFLE